MTELEAQALINLHRTHYPSVVQGRTRYVLQPDGALAMYRVTKSGKRSIYEHTSADPIYRQFLSAEVRAVWFGSENGK